MKALILDSSTCIDLHSGDLIRRMVFLRRTVLIPDVILAELIEPQETAFTNVGIGVASLTPDLVLQIPHLQAQFPSVSTNDIIALLCAKSREAILVTGDKNLRTASNTQGVECHGSLWVLDEFVASQILSKDEAALALKRMREAGGRFPKAECEHRLKRWER